MSENNSINFGNRGISRINGQLEQSTSLKHTNCCGISLIKGQPEQSNIPKFGNIGIFRNNGH